MKKRISLIVTTCFLVLAAMLSLYANASASPVRSEDNEGTVTSSNPINPLFDKDEPLG
ncbi:MAG TPA: hypothetical protein IAD15_04015 [Candidatus Fimiplasma intestinipullorum]|uniref:Uncharacterized protein n=1 Tax=Candidatus Fimiplasma intestinipullorum TaxID=2840825 RepID=A0A9D1HN83_9FIRM|nr:hypothetical protein [Candidatus Fimiplasma intestinipullorum]